MKCELCEKEIKFGKLCNNCEIEYKNKLKTFRD